MLGRFNFFCIKIYSKIIKKILSPFYFNKIKVLDFDKNDFKLITLCGKNGFDDLSLSIYSFIKTAGIPIFWKVYSDGTLTEKQIIILREIHFIDVVQFTLENNDIKYQEYIHLYPTAMKLFIMKYNTGFKHIFVDSDIVYFPRIKKYLHQFSLHSFYIIDKSDDYLDKSLISNSLIYNPLNLGFIVLNSTLNFNEFFDCLDLAIQKNKITYWTDQTIFNNLFKKFAFALPYNEFLTGGEDSFSFRHSYSYSDMCLRHFVGPVRHKMWQYNWEKLWKSSK